MNDTAIGTARIDVTVDTSQFDSAVSAAKRAVSDMSTSAQQQYQQLSAVEKRRVDSLVRQADTLNMTKAQQVAYNASLRSSGPILDEIVKKLATGEAAAKKAGKELNQYGISAAQQAAAMRGVPAQITDIFVSLQGGQRPMTVLLQQGGQLKDMFGGITPAVRALTGQLLAMINPATIAAGALAAVGYAWSNYNKEEAEFRAALLTTGDYAGVAAGQFNDLVAEIDALNGVTRGGAVAALTQVAASGRFAGEQFDIVVRSAARMEAATGQAIDKTISKFEEIAKAPVDALLKLNETEHFLTKAQFERVAALEDEGRKQEAVAEAVRIYGRYSDDVAIKAAENQSILTTMWDRVKDSASGAVGEVGRYFDLLSKLAAIKSPEWLSSDSDSWLSKVISAGNMGGVGVLARVNNWAENYWGLKAPGLGPSFQGVTSSVSSGDAPVDSEAEKKARAERKKAEEEWNRWVGQNLSKREKQQAEEARIIATAKALGKSQEEVDQQIAASRKRFAESEAKGSKKADPTQALAERIRQQIALNTEQLAAEAKLTTSQRLRVAVEQELLNLGAKATPERKEAINQLLKQLDATGALVDAKEKEVRATEQLQRLQAQIRVSEENRLRANTLDLMSYGRGGDAVDQLRRQLDIQREYQDGLKQLRDRGVAEDSKSWRRQEKELRASRDRMLDAEREFQRQRLAIIGDWRIGANAALEDYLAETKDIASQSRELFASAFSGAEDAIVQFVKTGKLSFSDLADSIIADLARIAARQMIVGVLGNALGGLFGGTTATGNALVSSGTQGINAELMGKLIPNAKGGAYNSPSLSAYSGGVYSTPQLFAFAKGAGVFGEAGPEAIMPLRRGSDGRLGVSATGGSAGNVVINNYTSSEVRARKETSAMPDGSQMERWVIDVVATDTAMGGKTAQAQKGRFDIAERI
ncbi:phage tail tape measure protein [Stenotrophomonas sp. NLF4-10]|uniref:phage tail tape measure protein n=1 Tax=Stenotrophomonas sp. NLF4-10 TaxID=2918754 RepID=UPI001EFACB05|nr:phage tail tape measure protein [Stenotrophomonas sp. NLF4-10]MCG8275409.1 phage tail tape measure protein [Stenotrophomonas sp. NLF4-10]